MNANQRVDRARQRRYRKAALAIIQRDMLEDELYNISSECSELEWSVEDAMAGMIITGEIANVPAVRILTGKTISVKS